MPTVTFDTYRYDLQSTRYNKNNSAAAALDLYNGNSLVAGLYFYYDEASANKPPVQSGSRVVLYYHMSMLDTIVDMLRNEDSTYLFHNISTGLGYMATGKEPVGEEENRTEPPA